MCRATNWMGCHLDCRGTLDANATRGRFTVVMIWAMDRLGRSLADLIDTLRALEAANVDLYPDQQAIDTTTPAGRSASM
jgi:DNA invertase Pin-like site-specific DNA recombinase